MFNELAEEIHDCAVDKGFWNTNRTFGDLTMLIASETMEAYEEYRHGKDFQEIYFSKVTNGSAKPEGIPIELADIVIRVLDICHEYGIDIDEAIKLKMEYNKTRPYRHGGMRT